MANKSLLPIPKGIASHIPAMVRSQLEKMTPQQQSEFYQEYLRRSKSSDMANLSWFLLGWHYAYFNKWGWQVLFWFTVGGFFLWWVIDFFRIEGMVRDWNSDAANAVMRDLKAFHQ